MQYDINRLSIIEVIRKNAEFIWKLKEHEKDLKSFLWDISKSQYKINFKILKNNEIWLNADRLRKENFIIILLYMMFSSLTIRICMGKDSLPICDCWHTSGINVGKDFHDFVFIFQ